jgi:hypothetical protein
MYIRPCMATVVIEGMPADSEMAGLCEFYFFSI